MHVIGCTCMLTWRRGWPPPALDFAWLFRLASNFPTDFSTAVSGGRRAYFPARLLALKHNQPPPLRGLGLDHPTIDHSSAAAAGEGEETFGRGAATFEPQASTGAPSTVGTYLGATLTLPSQDSNRCRSSRASASLSSPRAGVGRLRRFIGTA